MKPKISCIIITLNEEIWIKRILGSLKNQTFKDLAAQVERIRYQIIDPVYP